MTDNNPYKPANIKLGPQKRLLWLVAFIACGIYAIMVGILLFLIQLPIRVQLIIIFSYMFIGPLTLYSLWLVFYSWKTKKWSPSEKLVGGHKKYLLMIFLLGINIITYAAYWNSGIDDLWLLAATGVYYFSKDMVLASVIYFIGSSAITPALVEEFLKSFPSILAFFVVLQRHRNQEQKRKGLLGNELGGFLFGLIIGITFEILELILYLLFTISSGGGAIDIYLQVTVRSWAPIHILGGAIGGFAVGRAERLRFERGEENLPLKNQITTFLKRFIPLWLIPVSIHFLWNSSTVWIILYVYTINAQNTDLAIILQFTVYAVLGSLCYILLIIFARRANKIANQTYRCRETGIIVANESVVCTNFDDRNPTKITQISRSKSSNFCTNCGNPVKIKAYFCIYCGYNLGPFKSPQFPTKLYKRYTMILLIITLIVSILFIHYGLLLIISYFGILFLILFQISVIMVASGLMMYASISLILLRKNYDGRKSIWCWLILLLNLIGMFVLLLVYGIVGILYAPFLLGGGLGIIGIALIVLVFAGAATIFILLLFIISGEPEILQYQRNF